MENCPYLSGKSAVQKCQDDKFFSKKTAVRPFNLDKIKRKKKNIRKSKPENLIRRAGGLKKRNDLKYAVFEKLYELWCNYYRKLLEQMRQKPDERLLKADYHGCLLCVQCTPNPLQNGLHGIVVHESKYTFQMITKENKIIVIPKEGATFQFALDGKVFTLFGDALCHKPHLRGKKHRPYLRLPFFLP